MSVALQEMLTFQDEIKGHKLLTWKYKSTGKSKYTDKFRILQYTGHPVVIVVGKSVLILT